MPKIDWNRILLGGLVAGIVVNFCEYIISGVLLRDDWERALLALNRPLVSSVMQTAALQVWGFLMGFSGVALYAHLCDRYHSGWRTACRAGLAVWIVGYLSGSVTGASMGVFPASLAIEATIAGLFEILLATALGAHLYQFARK